MKIYYIFIALMGAIIENLFKSAKLSVARALQGVLATLLGKIGGRGAWQHLICGKYLQEVGKMHEEASDIGL